MRHGFCLERMARIPLFILILGACGLAQEPEPYLIETFDDAVENPGLAGYVEFKVSDGSLLRQPGNTGDQDRAYMRTVVTDYDTRDFVFDVIFTSGLDTITFVGIGRGDWQNSEPGPSARFRIHSPDVAGGYVGISSLLGEHTIANLRSRGPHCARIEKSGSRVTFSIDLDFDGRFKADGSRSYPALSELWTFDPGTARLFFGCGSQETAFDAVSVAPSESPISFRRGDTNGDGAFNIVDPIRILNFAFLGDELECLDSVDVDDDGAISITDAIGLLGYLFLGTLPPAAPFLECGLDRSLDTLGCSQHQACGES